MNELFPTSVYFIQSKKNGYMRENTIYANGGKKKKRQKEIEYRKATICVSSMPFKVCTRTLNSPMTTIKFNEAMMQPRSQGLLPCGPGIEVGNDVYK